MAGKEKFLSKRILATLLAGDVLRGFADDTGKRRPELFSGRKDVVRTEP